VDQAVEGFDEAKHEVPELAELSPGDSFIFNTRTGQVIAENHHTAKVMWAHWGELRVEY
jgi:hypothetical protein